MRILGFQGPHSRFQSVVERGRLGDHHRVIMLETVVTGCDLVPSGGIRRDVSGSAPCSISPRSFRHTSSTAVLLPVVVGQVLVGQERVGLEDEARIALGVGEVAGPRVSSIGSVSGGSSRSLQAGLRTSSRGTSRWISRTILGRCRDR